MLTVMSSVSWYSIQRTTPWQHPLLKHQRINLPNTSTAYFCARYFVFILPCEWHSSPTVDWLLWNALREVECHDWAWLGKGTTRVFPQRVWFCLPRFTEIQRSLWVGYLFSNFMTVLPIREKPSKQNCKVWSEVENLYLNHLVHGTDIKTLTSTTGSSDSP